MCSVKGYRGFESLPIRFHCVTAHGKRFVIAARSARVEFWLSGYPNSTRSVWFARAPSFARPLVLRRHCLDSSFAYRLSRCASASSNPSIAKSDPKLARTGYTTRVFRYTGAESIVLRLGGSWRGSARACGVVAAQQTCQLVGAGSIPAGSTLPLLHLREVGKSVSWPALVIRARATPYSAPGMPRKRPSASSNPSGANYDPKLARIGYATRVFRSMGVESIVLRLGGSR